MEDNSNSRMQFGFAPILILLLIGLIVAVVAVFFIFNQFGPKNLKTLPSPSPSISTYQSKKLESYDKYKEDIKERLNLSEEEFQALKRFSAED